MAAGLGKRMMPLTANKPKPLIEVAGKCLIDHTLDWLADSGIQEAVVNTHYLAEQIETHVASRSAPRVHISHEEVLLETGGGVRKAMPMLGDAPFFVTNSDVICLDGPAPALKRLRDAWRDDAMDVLLLLHPVQQAIGYHGKGDFEFSEGILTRRGANSTATYVFTGIQLLHPRLLRVAPVEPIFSLNVLYDAALKQQPARISAIIHDGAWLHVGDPQGIESAEAYLSKYI